MPPKRTTAERRRDEAVRRQNIADKITSIVQPGLAEAVSLPVTNRHRQQAIDAFELAERSATRRYPPSTFHGRFITPAQEHLRLAIEDEQPSQQPTVAQADDVEASLSALNISSEASDNTAYREDSDDPILAAFSSDNDEDDIVAPIQSETQLGDQQVESGQVNVVAPVQEAGETRSESRITDPAHIDNSTLSILESARERWCNCAPSNPQGDDDSPERQYADRSLSGMAQEIMSRFPTNDAGELLDPLELKDRRYTHDELRTVNWAYIFSRNAEPTESILRLSYELSERQCLDELGSANHIEIKRMWDVDSVLVRVDNASAFQDGLDVSFISPYLKTYTAPTHLGEKFGHPETRMNVFLGNPSCGMDWDVWAVFGPRLDGAKSLRPTDETLKQLLDKVWLPAIRTTCPSEVRSRFSMSYDHIHAMVHSKKELSAHEYGNNTAAPTLRHCIPQKYLDAWFQRSQALLRQEPALQQALGFRDGECTVMLVVARHNLKETYQDEDPDAMFDSFSRHLTRVFDVGRLQRDHIWIDYGAEDVVESVGSPPPVTLLRKEPCLRHWASLFSRREQSGYDQTTVHTYQFMGTRDAGSVDLTLAPTNELRSREFDHLTHCKAYNSNKSLFAVSALKGMEVFQSEDFLSGLAFSEPLLKHIAKTRRAVGEAGGLENSRQSRTNSFVQVVNRLRSSLKGNQDQHYQARFENRISMTLAEEKRPRQLSRLVVRGHGDVYADDSQHLPYWILRTHDVHEFVRAEIGRELLTLNAVFAASDSSQTLTEVEQMQNVVMAAALLGSIRAKVMGYELRRYPKLWRDQYAVRSSRAAGDDDDELQPETHGAGPDRSQHTQAQWDAATTQDRSRQGLDLRSSLRDTGMAWWKTGLVDTTNVVPRFRMHTGEKTNLAFVYGGLSYIRSQAGWTRESVGDFALLLTTLDQILRETGTDAESDIERQWTPSQARELCCELVVQQYVKDVIEFVVNAESTATRAPRRLGGVTSRASQRARALHAQREAKRQEIKDRIGDTWHHKLTAEGLMGLDHATLALMTDQHGVTTTVDSIEKVALLRMRTAGSSWLDQYKHNGSWVARMKTVFCWGEASSIEGGPPETDKSIRSWYDKPYRRLARVIYDKILVHHGQAEAEEFRLDKLPLIASYYLWALPRVARECFWEDRSTGTPSADARQQMAALRKCQKLTWYVAVPRKQNLDSVKQAPSTTAAARAARAVHVNTLLTRPKQTLVNEPDKPKAEDLLLDMWMPRIVPAETPLLKLAWRMYRNMDNPPYRTRAEAEQDNSTQSESEQDNETQSESEQDNETQSESEE